MINPIHSTRDYWNKNITKPLFTSAVILILAVMLLIIIDLIFRPGGSSFWDNIFAELHGMMFDVAIILFLFNLIESKREKKLRIERYKEEIEDYRGWNGPEASYRLSGLIRRMNKEGESNMNLNFCTLNDLDLNGLNLSGSFLNSTKIINSKLFEIDLTKASLFAANLTNSQLVKADLTSADLSNANLMGANLFNAILVKTKFHQANLENVYFEDANLYMADLYNANLSGAIIELYQLKTARLTPQTTMMDGTSFDESWAERINQA